MLAVDYMPDVLQSFGMRYPPILFLAHGRAEHPFEDRAHLQRRCSRSIFDRPDGLRDSGRITDALHAALPRTLRSKGRDFHAKRPRGIATHNNDIMKGEETPSEIRAEDGSEQDGSDRHDAICQDLHFPFEYF